MTKNNDHTRGREHNPVVAAFSAQLREVYGQCGAPTYRSLAKTSLHLAELYPGPLRDRDLTPLSVTAISEVLNGRRAGLPRAAWVVTFVLSCQRRAVETGVLDTDPGTQTVPDWIQRWRQAWATTQTTRAESPPPPATSPYEPRQKRP
jgi:hypothetical protein